MNPDDNNWLGHMLLKTYPKIIYNDNLYKNSIERYDDEVDEVDEVDEDINVFINN